MPKAKVSALSRRLQSLMSEQAKHLAQQSGLIKRQRKLTGAIFVQTLVFGWLQDPQASLESLAQHATALGAAITPQALHQRFTEAAACCLKALLSQALSTLVAADPVAVPLLARFKGVFLLDASTVVLPGCLQSYYRGTGDTTAALKMHLCWNYSNGALSALEFSAGRKQDRRAAIHTRALPQGALRITDLGYFALPRFRQLSQQGTFWLSRLLCGTAVFDAQGQRLADLPRWLAQQAAPGSQVQVEVCLGVNTRLPCRLLAERVPPAIAAQRRRKLRQQARAKGRTCSQARLAWADWTVLVSNVPEALLSVTEALVLYRVRWQIELLFKLWKRHGAIDQWRSHKPMRILCEIYAKLLAMVITHWMLLLGNWRFVDRSLTKAAQTVRNHAIHVMLSLGQCSRLREALTVLKRTLGAGCRIGKRGNPALHQLLLQVAEDP